MTSLQSFEARLFLGAGAAGASIALPAVSRFFRGPAEHFDRFLLAAFATSRLGLFTVVFLVLHVQPRGDIPAYYVTEAQYTLRHLLPYRDFPSSYAPLHSYLDAGALLIHPSPISIILVAILFECLAVLVWLRVARALVPENTRRIAGLLYLAGPLSLQFVTIDGQDNAIIAFAFGLAMLCLLRLRPALSGAILGASIAVVKFLPLLWVPAFFLALRQRRRWTLGLLCALVLGYGYFAAKHVDLLFPLEFEGKITGASNLPFVVTFLTGIPLAPRLLDLFLLACLAATFLWCAALVRGADEPTRLRILAWVVPFLTMQLVVLGKKSWPNYLILILFNLCLLPALRTFANRSLFAVLQFLGCVSHSLWSSFLRQDTALNLHALAFAGDRLAILLLFSQVGLVGLYLWVVMLVWRQLKAVRTPGGVFTSA